MAHKLTHSELYLLYHFLDKLGDIYGGSICNDWKFPNDMPDALKEEFCEIFNCSNTAKEMDEQINPASYTMDFAVVEVLKCKISKMINSLH